MRWWHWWSRTAEPMMMNPNTEFMATGRLFLKVRRLPVIIYPNNSAPINISTLEIWNVGSAKTRFLKNSFISRETCERGKFEVLLSMITIGWLLATVDPFSVKISTFERPFVLIWYVETPSIFSNWWWFLSKESNWAVFSEMQEIMETEYTTTLITRKSIAIRRHELN